MDRTEALEISEIAGNEIVERTKGWGTSAWESPSLLLERARNGKLCLASFQVNLIVCMKYACRFHITSAWTIQWSIRSFRIQINLKRIFKVIVWYCCVVENSSMGIVEIIASPTFSKMVFFPRANNILICPVKYSFLSTQRLWAVSRPPQKKVASGDPRVHNGSSDNSDNLRNYAQCRESD